MKSRLVRACVVAATLSAVTVTPAMADRKTTNTLIGIGVGALAGALLSNGDPMSALGGAAAGGLIGNVTTHDRRHYGPQPDYRYDNRAPDRGHDRRW
jgi:osmotically inducible lipoprotein OsmB